jgi:hypothetical protein
MNHTHKTPPGKLFTEVYTITLRAQPGDLRPAAVRLRQLLKLALRGFKLKCEAVTPEIGGRE